MSASRVEFRALGPVEIIVAGRPEAPYAAKPQTLLSLLLLDVNRVAERDWLIDQLWSGEPPKAAQAALRAYIYRLRKHLDQLDGGAKVHTKAGGYLLEVEPAAVDVHRFETLVTRGRIALQDGLFASARTTFQKGLDLWRGTAFAGIDVPAVRDKARRLDELRLEVTEQCLGAALESGPASGAVAELEALTAAHPLREGLWRLLMLSLYRDGRQSEALAAYQRLHQLLNDELGINPSQPVEQLHRQILTGDLVVADTTHHPRQLPAATPYFTGRASQLTELNELLRGVVKVAVLTGTAGIGKTALAVHWAHQVADRFPDGQLHVDLRGFDPVEQPMAPAGAVRAFLDALGIPSAKIPAGLDSQAALYRSVLADKRILVILDNARDADQVRALLPGGAGNLVLVTSRNQLAGLITLGAQPIKLTQLDPADAGRFLTRRLRGGRTATEPEAVQQIIDSCAGLPLALAIVAARAAIAPHFPLAVLSAQLKDANDRLDALADPDPAIDVRAVFSWSYRALSTEAAQLFRLLSVHPGPDITVTAAASLFGSPPQQLLTELSRANLLLEQTPGRYSFHDLLRAYATELAAAEDTRERDEATLRLMDFYLHTAYDASRLTVPTRDPIAVAPARPGVVPERLADAKQATAWLATERAVLLAVVDQAAGQGLDIHCWQLVWTLHHHLYRLGHWHDLAAISRTALEAIRRLGDGAAETRGLRLLADVYTRLERFDAAQELLDQALVLCRSMNDRIGQANTYQASATIWRWQDQFPEAIDCNRRALELFTTAGHRPGQARALGSLGWHLARNGDFEDALAYGKQAVALMQDIDDRPGEASVRHTFGYVHHALSQHHQAIAEFGQALDLYRDLEFRAGEAESLNGLGDSQQALGHHATARDAWRQALAIYDDLGRSEAERVRAKLSALLKGRAC